MYDIISQDDMEKRLAAEMDEFWFVDFFEITIEDLIPVFRDKIAERREEIAVDLGWFEKTKEYDDRED
jgi:hypothetical protein